MNNPVSGSLNQRSTDSSGAPILTNESAQQAGIKPAPKSNRTYLTKVVLVALAVVALIALVFALLYKYQVLNAAFFFTVAFPIVAAGIALFLVVGAAYLIYRRMKQSPSATIQDQSSISQNRPTRETIEEQDDQTEEVTQPLAQPQNNPPSITTTRTSAPVEPPRGTVVNNFIFSSVGNVENPAQPLTSDQIVNQLVEQKKTKNIDKYNEYKTKRREYNADQLEKNQAKLEGSQEKLQANQNKQNCEQANLTLAANIQKYQDLVTRYSEDPDTEYVDDTNNGAFWDLPRSVKLLDEADLASLREEYLPIEQKIQNTPNAFTSALNGGVHYAMSPHEMKRKVVELFQHLSDERRVERLDGVTANYDTVENSGFSIGTVSTQPILYAKTLKEKIAHRRTQDNSFPNIVAPTPKLVIDPGATRVEVIISSHNYCPVIQSIKNATIQWEPMPEGATCLSGPEIPETVTRALIDHLDFKGGDGFHIYSTPAEAGGLRPTYWIEGIFMVENYIKDRSPGTLKEKSYLQNRFELLSGNEINQYGNIVVQMDVTNRAT